MGYTLRTVVLCCLVGIVCGQWTFNPPKPEGEHCGSLRGVSWTCQKETSCPTARALAARGWKYTCSQQGNEHVICCPPPTTPPDIGYRYTHSISTRKCHEYQAAVCEGRLVGDVAHSMDVLTSDPNDTEGESIDSAFPGLTRDENNVDEDVLEHHGENSDIGSSENEDDETAVFNGEEAKSGEFPHAVAIGYQAGSTIMYNCGGTLISELFVMSAAHCASADRLGPARWALLGDLVYDSDKDIAKPQRIRIIDRIVHPKYNSSLYYNDIALFRLERPAEFNEYVAPACLPARLPTDMTTSVTASGWGNVETHKHSSRLMKVDLNFMETQECQSRYNKEGGLEKRLPSGIDSQTQVCAWKKDKDTCPGDSGSPLQLTNPGRSCLGQVVGITSFGPDLCDASEFPGIYVRVAAFLPWIEAIVWSNSNSG